MDSAFERVGRGMMGRGVIEGMWAGDVMEGCIMVGGAIEGPWSDPV
jgi:hypothetical protein